MVYEGIYKPNVTVKGDPRKFWGLFGEKAHKTQQITLSQPQKGGLSLTLMSHRQAYNPKCKPKHLPDETMGFSWDQNPMIGSIPKIEFSHLLRQCH